MTGVAGDDPAAGDAVAALHSPLGEGLAALSRFFVGDGTLHETLRRVSELTTEAVPAADMVALTMVVEGRARTAVSTDALAAEVDQAQYDTGDGPCLAAFERREVFSIEATREPGRWPAFRQSAASHGILSTLSLPMVVNQQGVGAMNLYARRERAFSGEDREVAQLFAAQAAIALANAQAYWDARELSAGLGEAMKSRAVIEQAKGVLMAAQRCSEDKAFEFLVNASQRENVKLRDIATRIVDNASRPPQ